MLDRAIMTTYQLLKVCSFLATILNAVLLPAAVTYVRQITVSYPSTDFSVQYSNVTRSCMGLLSLWEIAIFPQPEVGHWPSDIGSTVDPSQQQLGFLSSKTHFAFMYAYRSIPVDL